MNNSPVAPIGRVPELETQEVTGSTPVGASLIYDVLGFAVRIKHPFRCGTSNQHV